MEFCGAPLLVYNSYNIRIKLVILSKRCISQYFYQPQIRFTPSGTFPTQGPHFEFCYKMQNNSSIFLFNSNNAILSTTLVPPGNSSQRVHIFKLVTLMKCANKFPSSLKVRTWDVYEIWDIQVHILSAYSVNFKSLILPWNNQLFSTYVEY